jgi:hypothetical protein
VKRAPAHAGGLRMSERLAFVVMFSLMAAFVVGLTVLAAKSGASPLIGRSAPASVRTIPPRSVPDQVGGKRGSAADGDGSGPCNRGRRGDRACSALTVGELNLS